MTTTQTQQPKALQLADRLKERIRQLNNSWNAKWNRSTEEFDLCEKSEDELRRLHAENEALKAAQIDVKSAMLQAAAMEREACAMVCDELQDVPATEPRHCAADIRARGAP